MKTLDILGLGSSCVDDFLIVDTYPGKNEKVYVSEARRQGGGLTGSALVAAAHQGCVCGQVIRLGGDEISAFIRESLTREGIRLFEQTVGEGFAAYHSIIIVEKGSGERTILSKPPAKVAPEIGEKEFALLDHTKCLYVDYIYAAQFLGMVERGRAMGLPVVGDFEGVSDRSGDLMALVDHLIVPLQFGKQATGASSPEAAATALAKQPGRRLACVTDSERGCWFALGDRPEAVVHAPAFKVDKVVDTTGCGDVFHGAYTASLVQGFPLPACIRRAAASAAIKAGRLGAQKGSPTRAELDEFLKNA